MQENPSPDDRTVGEPTFGFLAGDQGDGPWVTFSTPEAAMLFGLWQEAPRDSRPSAPWASLEEWRDWLMQLGEPGSSQRRSVQSTGEKPQATLHLPPGMFEPFSKREVFVFDTDSDRGPITDDLPGLQKEVRALLESGSDRCPPDTFTDRERTVIEMRFGLHGGPPSTVHEIGRSVGVTVERVMRIEAKVRSLLESPSEE